MNSWSWLFIGLFDVLVGAFQTVQQRWFHVALGPFVLLGYRFHVSFLALSLLRGAVYHFSAVWVGSAVCECGNVWYVGAVPF